MSGFQTRLGPAVAWEARLIEILIERGWLAAPFGQAQVPSEMRSHLARWIDDYGHATLLRWTPDIIAVKPTEKPFVCLIDAKTERVDNATSSNYSIEINAVDAGLTIVRDWHMPLFYVWEDGGVLTPQTVVNRWNRKLDGAGSTGSKTAFYLVAKSFARSNREIFPAVVREAA
jgi:hypothetical protein